GPGFSSRRCLLTDQEYLAAVLRVLRKVDESRREVGARNVVRSAREVLSSDLGSNPARLAPIREVRRADNGPVDWTRCNEPLHPSKVGIRLSKNPPDESEQNPGPPPCARRDA